MAGLVNSRTLAISINNTKTTGDIALYIENNKETTNSIRNTK